MPCRAGAQPRWSLSRGSWDGVAEPDPDRGEVDGSAECVVAFVVAGGHRPVGLELVDGAFDDVALLVDLGVEPGWPPTRAAPPEPVADDLAVDAAVPPCWILGGEADHQGAQA